MIHNLFLIFVTFEKKIIIQENVCCYIYSEMLFPFKTLSEQQFRATSISMEVTNKRTNYKMTQHVLPESEGEKCQQMKNKNIRFKFNPH